MHPAKPQSTLLVIIFLQHPNLHRHLRHNLLHQPLRPHLRPNNVPALFTPPRPNPRRPHPRRRLPLLANGRLPLRPPASPLCLCGIQVPAQLHRLRHPVGPEAGEQGCQIRRPLLRPGWIIHLAAAALVYDGEQRERQVQDRHRHGAADRAGELGRYRHESRLPGYGGAALSNGLCGLFGIAGHGGSAHGGVCAGAEDGE